MGAVCDQAPTQSFPKLQQIQTVNVSNFKECEWPEEDSFFLNRIEQIKSNQEQAQFLQGKQLKKHRVNEEYYLGNWDLAGYQKGEGLLYKPGDLYYKGNFDSAPHGNGILYDLKNQVVYEGEFNHGRVEGHTKITKQKVYSYEGIVNSDSHPTTGKLIMHNPQDQSKSFTVILHNYPAFKARIQYKDGREYEGYININTFLPENQGTCKYPNDSIYQGNWLNGEFHGKGKFTWPNGSEYIGDYLQGKKHGHGRFTYPSKKVYEGEWVDGKQEGLGCLFEQSGDKSKKGYWKNGVFDRQE